jgi:hypothetical protein
VILLEPGVAAFKQNLPMAMQCSDVARAHR